MVANAGNPASPNQRANCQAKISSSTFSAQSSRRKCSRILRRSERCSKVLAACGRMPAARDSDGGTPFSSDLAFSCVFIFLWTVENVGARAAEKFHHPRTGSFGLKKRGCHDVKNYLATPLCQRITIPTMAAQTTANRTVARIVRVSRSRCQSCWCGYKIFPNLLVIIFFKFQTLKRTGAGASGRAVLVCDCWTRKNSASGAR